MNLSQAEDLLVEAAKLHQPRKEKSIFDVGARGYYENPTTDLLAFFLDTGETHGLGNCFLCALLDCVEEKLLPASLSQAPQREVSTVSGKRMDLLLHGEGWGLLLENKIFSDQDNPFSDYEEHFDELAKKNNWQHQMHIILSPSGESRIPGWTGLKYGELVAAVRAQLAQHASEPLEKGRVLAEEFLLHLHHLTVETEVDREAFHFVFKKLLPQTRELRNLCDQAINALDERILKSLEQKIPEYKPYAWKATWSGDPVLRYGCEYWENWSNVTLYLQTQENRLKPLLLVYLCDVDAMLKQEGRNIFASTSILPVQKQREENKGSVLVFEWKLDEFEEQRAMDAVIEKMKILMRFEALRLERGNPPKTLD